MNFAPQLNLETILFCHYFAYIVRCQTSSQGQVQYETTTTTHFHLKSYLWSSYITSNTLSSVANLHVQHSSVKLVQKNTTDLQ